MKGILASRMRGSSFGRVSLPIHVSSSFVLAMKEGSAMSVQESEVGFPFSVFGFQCGQEVAAGWREAIFLLAAARFIRNGRLDRS